ncbi:MAG: CinA family protein [Bacilli bacterium]|nr:CinA family protein [Bacilli bacterium]
MNNFEIIVNKLLEKNKTISTMESCTGGLLASDITCIPNSSEIFHFGAVTYSNEYKIKMGVSSDVIDKYTVYSIETAKEMAKAISSFTSSDYGVGVTGQINKQDPNNPVGVVGEVFFSIYDKSNDRFYEYSLNATEKTRELNKKLIVDYISTKLLEVLDVDN